MKSPELISKNVEMSHEYLAPRMFCEKVIDSKWWLQNSVKKPIGSSNMAKV